ncbi:4Fe-4S ferredoxin [Alicyclobacillus cellulosilyticus]|uniref:Ferredoxin n=1 Tax=Alicyclobacillus cellulosilyticus TaxID=1003997 RepID=A0A917KG01_9BACL|nr:ferredoxin family protein [Alicyclobacillus cellulosilyticus]GGJ12204.1 4Fe-4S ferredoxin [Alicyclobacillus cellulosilyticus]
MAFVITSPCIGEKAAECVEACPVDAIHDAGETYLINPDVCIDCGACEPVCPVAAIYHEDDVPEEEQEWIEINRRFFQSA